MVSPLPACRLQEGKVSVKGSIGPHASSPWVSPQVFGFFKGMAFPLTSIAVYNSVVFGVFSNTQRFLSHHRCQEPEAGSPRVLSDLLLASMVAGVVSVGLGAPVDLIKIRLQMQTQPFREGKRPGEVALCLGTCDPFLVSQAWNLVNNLFMEQGIYVESFYL